MAEDLPLIVQSNSELMLEVHGPLYAEARDALAAFAELVKSPEHIHTYRVSPLSLWNAASAGLSADSIMATLARFSRYPVPEMVSMKIRDYMGLYGTLRLKKDGRRLVLESDDPFLIDQFLTDERSKRFLGKKIDANRVVVPQKFRGEIKRVLIRMEFPVEDMSGYMDGEALNFELRGETLKGKEFYLRPYQRDAVDVFYAGGSASGGSGVLVLPCGAGKTVIGIGAMHRYQQKTLILTTNITALRQWREEVLDKTTLEPDQVREYSGETKEIGPVTIATYQILTYHKAKGDEFIHMDVFDAQPWGLIIYDEVHLLPAPVFRAVANLQARRRLGLTATLVREDEKETDVFSLIGPKKFDVPWKVLESQGWIAHAECLEVRVGLPEEKRMEYATADAKSKFRLAAENEAKIAVARKLVDFHPDDQIMIIGQYLDQLDTMAAEFNAPLITGKTPNDERETIYSDFKEGRINLIIVSKVANFAVDLPSASVAIQISGTYGSRQEEAQRLGRVLRPKADGKVAHFYTLVTEGSREREFAEKRELFLAEQGYRYRIIKCVDDLLEPAVVDSDGQGGDA